MKYKIENEQCKFYYNKKWITITNPDGTPFKCCIDAKLDIYSPYNKYSRIKFSDGWNWINEQGRIFSTARYMFVDYFYDEYARVKFSPFKCNWMHVSGSLLNDEKYFGGNSFIDGFSRVQVHYTETSIKIIDTFGIVYENRNQANRYEMFLKKYLKRNTFKLFIFRRFI